MQLKRSEKLELILESLPKTIEACKAWERDRNVGIQAAIYGSTDWQVCEWPSFNLEKYKYRIREKAPITQEQAEALVETVVINNAVDPPSRFFVIQTDKSGVWFKKCQFASGGTYHVDYENLMNGFWESKEGIKLWR